jgi:hypothetical protein
MIATIFAFWWRVLSADTIKITSIVSKIEKNIIINVLKHDRIYNLQKTVINLLTVLFHLESPILEFL